MDRIDCYNALIFFKEDNNEDNDKNFLDGFINYFDNINKIFGICDNIEKLTEQDINSCLLPSFKSEKVFNDDFNKFDILKLKFKNSKKVYDLLIKELKEEYKDKIRIEFKDNIIFIYVN